MLTAVAGVPAVFPNGHLPGPRWRWLAWSAIAAIIFLFLASVLAAHTQESRLAGWHNPLGLPVRYGNVANAFAAAGILLAVAAAAGAIAGLVTRWRRGGPLVRQQQAGKTHEGSRGREPVPVDDLGGQGQAVQLGDAPVTPQPRHRSGERFPACPRRQLRLDGVQFRAAGVQPRPVMRRAAASAR